ncbi:DUF6252 family protein [Ichthyenterobacterium sp. W332]|uniref:DUF6252 family protein n=1 Tax=Microcosmobacter mediterraneus TaxID=3075607 RepID=A0ABU2YNP3_9FLAO|nr:DUF6252 family protein [Ichthyenterobacterium sp. W332]MDT0559677.1 DUF6252 family protein [Ichthyenterobacterium sp. W332]
MKKLLTLLIIFTTCFGCGDDVEFNTPAIQGNRDGELWRATFYAADIDFGGFIFEGGNGIETLQLITPTDTASPVPFDLGPNTTSVAIYRDAQGVIYSTANEPDSSLSLYPSDGQIEVEFVDTSSEPFRINGKFWFTAYSQDGLRSINFNEGFLHRVPLIGGIEAIGNQNACLQATQALNTAQQTFNSTATDAPEYPDACSAYKNALQDAIDACGDTSGALQAIFDALDLCV